MLRIFTCRESDESGASEIHIAAMVDGYAVSLERCHAHTADPAQLLAPDRLARVPELMAQSNRAIDLDRVEFLPPIPNPGKIICVGVNYIDRNAEYKDGSTQPQYPSLFLRTPQSFVGHECDIILPRESTQFDYEGEIVIVIGTAGRRIARADAHQHIGGLTIMNEGSVRDWMRHGKFNVTQGKNWDRSGAIGPWIETDLTMLDLNNLPIETRVNNEVRQAETTTNMLFSMAWMIEYVSTFTELRCGDMIATGTPIGAGARMNPPRWLQHGDEVTVTVAGVGALNNRVRTEV